MIVRVTSYFSSDEPSKINDSLVVKVDDGYDLFHYNTRATVLNSKLASTTNPKTGQHCHTILQRWEF